MTEFSPLPFAEWPDADRDRWLSARDPQGLILSKPKACLGWSQRTWQTVEDVNSMWLGWLRANDALEARASPGSRCTPERLRRFVEALLGRGGATNASIHIQNLIAIFKVFDPDASRRCLRDAARHLRRRARFRRRKELPSVREFLELANELRELGLSRADGRELVDFARLRDGLAAAMLPRRAFRRCNFANLTIGEGQDIQLIGDTYWIFVSPGSTKTGVSRPKPFPTDLVPMLVEYLAARERILAGVPTTPHLWISNRRRPLRPLSMSDAMARRSKPKFGRAYRMHIHRHVVSSNARDGEKAAKMLDNSPEVARGCYRHASKGQSLRDFHDMLGLGLKPQGD